MNLFLAIKLNSFPVKKRSLFQNFIPAPVLADQNSSVCTSVQFRDDNRDFPNFPEGRFHSIQTEYLSYNPIMTIDTTATNMTNTSSSPNKTGMIRDPVQFIGLRRNQGRPYTSKELEWWIEAYTEGEIPEYQMAAWLMAVNLNGLTADETAVLTRCMVASGQRLDWQGVTPRGILVDKHSTGGVGDKVSLVLAPLAACMGLQVPMMAGRGLGHTGEKTRL